MFPLFNNNNNNKKVIFVFVSIYVAQGWVWCVHVSTSIGRIHQKASDPLELKLQAVVSYLMWVLGVELRSSGRAVSTPNWWLSL